jgi:hypothetical protein
MRHLLSSLYFTVVFLYMFREPFAVVPWATVAQGTTDWRLPYHGTYYHILRLVPVVVRAVFRTPDDGRKVLPKHVEEYHS